MAVNWVMLAQDGNIVRLPAEKILLETKSRTALDLSVPQGLPGQYQAKSDTGRAYITNRRLIYLPADSTDDFQSFSAPLLSVDDSHVSSSFFGPWSWHALVSPVSGGGVPPDVLRLELKLTFRDGGHHEFREKYELIRERLAHARDLQAETGQRLVVDDEPLPVYEEAAPAPTSANPEPDQHRQSQTSGPGYGPADSGAAEASPPAAQAVPYQDQQFASDSAAQPSEPPPAYEQAQADAVRWRFETPERGGQRGDYV